MKDLRFEVEGALVVKNIQGVDFFSASVKVPMDENEYGYCGKSAILAVVGGSVCAVIVESLIYALWMHKTLPQFEDIDRTQVEWKSEEKTQKEV